MHTHLKHYSIFVILKRRKVDTMYLYLSQIPKKTIDKPGKFRKLDLEYAIDLDGLSLHGESFYA